MKVKQLLLTLVVMLSAFVVSVSAQNVAKIGTMEYATLKAAMTEANKAAGNYTITLLSNSAEVFTFAQKSGVNITIDGDQHTFSGKITLSAGAGTLKFTNATIAPANSQTIYLNASTAPNVTFDGCTLQGKNKSGAIVFGYASATTNSVKVINCTADNLQYIVSHRQTGAKSVLIENVTATNMIYLVRTLKCPNVTVKNVTVTDAVIGVEIKNDGAGKLTLEDVNINIVTYNGSLYVPVSGSGAGKSWTINTKGTNTFSANGVVYAGNDWFSGNAGYTIVDLNPIKVGEKTFATFEKALAAANAGETITLLKDVTGAGAVINKNITIDFDGHTYTFNKAVGSNGTETLGFQIMKGTNVTLKNGTLTSTDVVEGKEVKVLVQNYADNLVLEDMNLVDATEHILYALSCNNGNTEVKGATNITTDKVAFDSYKSNSYGAPKVTINTTGTIAGNIECNEGASIVLKNGTFTVEPQAAWFEFGYSAKRNDDGTYGVAVATAKIGNKSYETLAAAIKDATADATITLLADVTENVTISKNLTIDGAGKTYTGKMTLKADATIKNLNFDGKGYDAYAVETRGANYLTIDSCTAKNYGYGFVQLASGTVLTTIKNVTVNNMNYGVKVDYSNAVVLENVDITAGVAAVLNSNYGEKTITIKNSEITTIYIWERNQTTYTTFKFEGKNTVAEFPTSKLVKYQGVIVGSNAYGELTDALATLKADDVLNIYSNYTIAEPISVKANLTINGNGKTLTYTGNGAGARAITVDNTANGADLTINNLIVDCTSSYCQRGINYNTTGALTLNGVTVDGKNVTYALNLPGSSDNAQVTINNSSLTANIALNVWGKNMTINAENSNFTSVDNNTAEGYSAIALNNDGSTIAEGTIVNITGGTITAKDEKGNLASAVRNATATGQVNVSDETVVTGIYTKPVAIVTYGGDQFYSCATLQDAIDKAIATKGNVKLIADVTASEIITVNAALVIDGNGKTLTSTAARAINVETDGKVVINNLTVKAGERAFNIINKPATVELNGVTATATNNVVMIATTAGAANVTIDGAKFTGLAVVNVAGAGSQVAIKNSTITNVDTNPNENYGAITVYTTAENAVVNVENTEIKVAGDSKQAYVFPATAEVNGVNQVGRVVATIGDAGYETLAEAIEDAKAGQTINIVYDVTASDIITVNKALTINGNGRKLTSKAARAINVSGADGVTIKNLTVVASGERAFNVIQNATNLTLENVTATAANYTVNVAASAPNAVVTITNSTLNGLCTVNVSAEGANVTVDHSTVNCNDNNTTAGESYAALCLNKEAIGGSIVATNSTINVAEGSDSCKGRNGAENGTVTINGSTEDVLVVVAVITYPGSSYYHGFATLAKAVEFAKEGDVITLLRNTTGAGAVIDKSITIDFNGKTYTFNKAVGSKGTETLGLQILKGTNVVLKNGTLKSTAVVEGKEVKVLVQNYAETLVLEDMNLVDETAHILYALSCNNGTTELNGNTNITTDAVAFDSYNSQYYNAPTVTVNTTGIIEGNIERNEGATIVLNSGLYSIDVTPFCEPGYMASKNAEGLYAIVVDPAYGKVAKIGDIYYATLREAVEAAANGATVELIADVTLGGGYDDATEGLRIEKAMTLDGKGHTIDCGTFQKGIRIYGPSNLTDMNINNVTIVNNNANGRCVDTRSGYLRLKFNNAHLVATNGNSQPLTVGGSEKLHQIDLSACTIDAGNSGYGIISFVPVNQAIKIMNTDVTGYAGIYLKGDGTKVTITTNSKVIGKNIHSGETNGFGAVVFEGNNNVVNINATSPMLKAIAEGGAEQAAILVVSGSNNKVVFETNKKAEVLAEGANSYWAMVSAEAANTSITKDGVAVELVAQCDGFQFISFEDAMRYAKDGSTVKLLADIEMDTKKFVPQNDGYATLVNVKDMALTIDLNGKAMTVNANAAQLASAKGGMLLSVFHADTNGQLTITDSSAEGKGAVNVYANDAKVYSLAASESKYTDKSQSGKIIVNGGNFYFDKAGDSMFFSDANEVITINGGNFSLGNVGTGANGSPWIFNTYERNERHVTVNGGTFNADVNHQYWAFEVKVPVEKALRNNNDGTWTVVESEAWILEKYNATYNRYVGYATLEEALAVENNVNNTVTLAKNVDVEDMITIANGETLVLDLNGKTLAATDNTTKNYSAIDNRGDLTITGNGTMTVEATVNSGWGRYSAVIANNPGGKLTIENGTIEHLGGTDMAYGIDNLTNGKGSYAETVINGGTVKSTYRAVRQFLNGVEADNILTVNGGTLEGANKSIFFHDPSAKANTGTLYVADNAVLKGDVYLFVTEGSTEWPVEVEIAKTALKDESKVLSANVPEGYSVTEYPTYWTVEALNLAELTIEDECEEYINMVEKTVGKLTYTRTYTGEWETLYLPFAVPFANLKDQFEVAYIYNAKYLNNEIVIDQVALDETADADFVLAANYPYLIRAKEAGYKEIVVDNAKLMPTTSTTIDCSSVFETFKFIGNYNTLDVNNLESGKGYFDLNGAWTRMYTLNPFRVYMQVEMRNGEEFVYPEVPARMRRVDESGNVEIEDVNSIVTEQGNETEPKEDMIFDLNGRRISQPVKGFIYIINGQKVLY